VPVDEPVLVDETVLVVLPDELATLLVLLAATPPWPP